MLAFHPNSDGLHTLRAMASTHFFVVADSSARRVFGFIQLRPTRGPLRRVLSFQEGFSLLLTFWHLIAGLLDVNFWHLENDRSP